MNMDDTQGSRMSDTGAKRKRRSSILKNQRPPRTPFSELEFNVATPTDTAKSRRVSFSRRTDVAEFVTNEATTTWKTMYVEQNRSLESSGNESALHPSRPTVCSLGKRAIFEQQFTEEAVDLGMPTPNPRVHEMNMSLMNINFSQQIADLEREDIKFSAPQKLEMSAFTEDRNMLFGEMTAPTAGVSNKIEVDFSAIQLVGDKCDDLDEIQRDLLGSNGAPQLRRPFVSPDASEYIEIDLNTTHIGLKPDASDMSITDSIRSPVKGIPQENLSLKRDTSNSKNDWTADKENIAINPYIAPKESLNFAINEMPDQVLVFDGRKLSVQTERQVFDGNGGGVEFLEPMPSNEPPAQKKTIVLNVNDDLPNFADGGSLLGQVHGLSTTNDLQPNPVVIPTGLGPNSHKTVIYDDLANLSVTQAIPTNILEKERRKTIVFENEGGELSMTQALPSNFAPKQNRTVVYGSEDISFTQALPVKVLSPPRDVAQNRTVVYASEDISFTQAVPVKVLSNEINKTKPDSDISFTQALPSNVLLSSKLNQSNKRNTTVYANETGDISITRVLPSNIIVSDLKTDEPLISANLKSLQRKSIAYDKGFEISMTEAVPKNIILANELMSDDIKYNNENIISETKKLLSNIVESVGILERNEKEYKDGDSLRGSDKMSTNMSITEAIPENVLLSHLLSKRKTIDATNMSVTRVLPTVIITTEKSMSTDNFNDFSITQAVPNNIILNDIQKTDATEQTDLGQKSEKDVEGTVVPPNMTMNNSKMQVTDVAECENLSKSFAKTDLSKSNMYMTIAQANQIIEVGNLLDKSQSKSSPLCNESINNISMKNLESTDNLNDSQKKQKIEKTSYVLVSDDKKELDQKELNASLNANIHSKSMSSLEEHDKYLNKDESLVNIMEKSKHVDRNRTLVTIDTENEVLFDKSCKQSEETLHTSKNVRDESELFKNSEKNTQKSVTEMNFRDVFVYQAVTKHNVSKQIKNFDNIHSNIPKIDLSMMDIVPKSITLANAIESYEMKIDDVKNISKNNSLPADVVELDGILEISAKEEQKNGDGFEKFPINVLISPKRKTLNLTEVEIDYNDVTMESPQRSDVALGIEHKEQSFGITALHNASATQQKSRKSILIQATSENGLKLHLNNSKKMDKTDFKDDHEDIVMESEIVDKEHEEQYSVTNAVYNESAPQMKKSIVIEVAPEMPLVHLNKRKTIDQIVKDDHIDMVMESPQQIYTLKKENNEQFSRVSTIDIASTTQQRPRKSILSELLNMSDDSMDVSAECKDPCEIAEKELKNVLEHNESHGMLKSDEELKENRNDKSCKPADVSQHNENFEQGGIEELRSPKITHYGNILSVNFESTQLNDEPKQTGDNSIVDAEEVELKKDEMTVDEAKIDSENQYKDADDTKELLEMLSDLTDKTMIKKSQEQPTERVEEKIAPKENSCNEPTRISLSKNRLSTVLSREDLLMNISMAYAALQQARTDTDESDHEDTLEDSVEDQIEAVEPEEIAVDEIDEAIEELDTRRRSIRASTEVVKTLQFDETMTEISRSEDNLSPLRKSVYGNVSQTLDSRARVIPSYEVSDEVKLLMQDLVKPLADDTVFGKTSPEKSVKPTNSTRSINLQANIITSSQIDIDMESESDIVETDVQTDLDSVKIKLIQSPDPVKEPVLHKNEIRPTLPVLMFDAANPLNNVILPKGSTEIHKYSPNKLVEPIVEEKQSFPMKPLLEKNEEYNIQRVSTHYNINTSGVDMDYTENKNQHNPDEIDGNFDTPIKDSKVNTLIAMKCNKELLEETSCLTLVDDEDQESIEVEDSQIDVIQPEDIKKTSPLQVIFKTDACDGNYTSSVDLDSDDLSKPKKRIYSPAKPDPTKKVTLSSPNVTPKPLSKIQKFSNTPTNTSKPTSKPKESLKKSSVQIVDSVSSKGKFGGTVIVQQMAESKIDSSVDAVSSRMESEHSSCTLKAETSICRSITTAASKDVCYTHSDPTPLSWSNHKEKEIDVAAERESSANVLEKLDSLPFMGSQDCQWDWSDANTISFRLLRGRLRLVVLLDHVNSNRSRVFVNGNTCHGHVKAGTPVLSAAVELVQEDADPLSQTCLRLATEAMRYECVRGRVATARSVPTLLRRCVSVAKVARTWVRVMREARMHLAYKMGKDGSLRLNVANIPLRTIYEITLRIELAVDDAKEAAWARADRVRVRDVTPHYTRHARQRPAGDVTTNEAIDVERLLTRIPHDWGHVPRTLWKVFKHLKNKTKDDMGLSVSL